jgi:ABC-2 type transport system ATP-binding protein
MEEAAEMCDRVALIHRGRIVAMNTPDNLSITGGRIFLVDVSFDRPVNTEQLAQLPGVNRLETTQAIEAADRLRAQQAMASVGKPGGKGGGGGGQGQVQTAGGPAAGAALRGMGAGKLPGVDNGEGKKSENRFRLFTENTTLLVGSLVDFSRANSLQMNILNVRPPSLEDAFVRLTEEKSHVK